MARRVLEKTAELTAKGSNHNSILEAKFRIHPRLTLGSV